MGNKRIPFLAGKTYHVYNHGNGNENIFRCPENYRYFLQRYAQYIYPIADTFAYCLLPNHFHFLLRLKEEKVLGNYYKSLRWGNPQGFKKNLTNLRGFKNLVGLNSKQFSNWLNAYTKAFNKKYDRKGRLFLESLERKLVDNDSYYTCLVTYIHNNAVHHGFVKEAIDWAYSSYYSYVSNKNSKLNRKEVFTWFGDKRAFVDYHRQSELKQWEVDLPY